MKTFKPNSIEAVILFILYICMQDKTISKEETKELLVTAPILNKMYLDKYSYKLFCTNSLIASKTLNWRKEQIKLLNVYNKLN